MRYLAKQHGNGSDLVRSSVKATVRIFLLERSLSYRDFAQCLGLHVGTVTNVINGYSSSRPVRAAIEWFFQRPIWCTGDELRGRIDLAPDVGGDVAQMSFSELVAVARRHKIRGRTAALRSGREGMLVLLAQHFLSDSSRPARLKLCAQKRKRKRRRLMISSR